MTTVLHAQVEQSALSGEVRRREDMIRRLRTEHVKLQATISTQQDQVRQQIFSEHI